MWALCGHSIDELDTYIAKVVYGKVCGYETKPKNTRRVNVVTWWKEKERKKDFYMVFLYTKKLHLNSKHETWHDNLCYLQWLIKEEILDLIQQFKLSMKLEVIAIGPHILCGPIEGTSTSTYMVIALHWKLCHSISNENHANCHFKFYNQSQDAMPTWPYP